MQIRELNIDGFGEFFDKKISGFSSGLHIIFGENESGKTTTLEFIRRVLFGFYVKKSGGLKNIYPALRGGVYGGKMNCLSRDGKPFTIVRTGNPGSKKGTVTVLADSKEYSGQSHLEKFLGHATEEMFKNIYAFTLDDLQDFGLLEGDEIKNKIYGAGLGLGQVSLADVNKYFINSGDSLFKPKGANQSINSLWGEVRAIEQKINEVKSHSSLYGELTAKNSRLNLDLGEIESKIEKLEALHRSLNLRIDLYSTYRDLADEELKLDALDPIEKFSDSAMDEFNRIKSKSESCEATIDEELRARDKLMAQCGSLEINEALLEKEADITALLQMTDKVRSALHDQIVLSQDRDTLNQSIQNEIKRISNDWNENRVNKFELTESERSHAASFEEKIFAAQQDKKSAEDKLDLHREQKAAALSSGWDVPPWSKYVTIIFTVGGILGSAWGAIQSNFPLLAFSIGVFVFGGLFFWLVTKENNGFRKKDVLESTLSEKLQKAINQETQVQKQWRSWLADHHMDNALTTSDFDRIVVLIEKIKTMLRERSSLDQRGDQMMETEKTAKALVKDIAVCLPNISSDNNLPAAIELIGSYLKDAKRSRNEYRVHESNIEAQNNRLTNLRIKQKELDAILNTLIRKAGAEDEAGFNQKHEDYEKQNRLKNSIAEKRKHIKARVGSDDAYKNFISELESTTPLSLENESSRISLQLEEQKEKRKELNQSIGEIRNQINQLKSNDELLTLQIDLEMKKNKLNILSRDWAVSRLALHILNKGKQEYENNHQPDVIKSASRYFSRITKYSKVVKPPDIDDIFICDDAENRKGVSEMSRGTREQLYLSMRLGLIEEYETRSEPLPVVMDDVFVNFDDDRREKVIKILKEFSADRQVIILSCHKHSLDLYTQLGARQILIN